VSGIIGAIYGNTNGIDGVNPFSGLVGYAVDDSQWTSIRGIVTLAAMPDVQVINVSMGFEWQKRGPITVAMMPNIIRVATYWGIVYTRSLAAFPNVVIVCAAGNECDQVPLALAGPLCNAARLWGVPNIIIVGSHDLTGTLSGFSNSGAD